MKLSDKTLSLLKNFAAINSNILIVPGKKLTTWAVAKNVAAHVEVDEAFTTEFGIFNLSEFLGVLGLMQSPDITFTQNLATIQENKNQIKYASADKSILVYPDKKLVMPPADVTVTITSAQLTQILKAAASLSVQDVAFVGDGKRVVIRVFDKKNTSSNSYTIDLDVETTQTFAVYFKVENFKQFPDDYEVSLCKKNISQFVGKTHKVTYFIAVEDGSSFSP